MWVLGEVFGMERDLMIIAPNEKEGRFLLSEIEQAGNFGHRIDRNVKKLLGLFLLHTKRNLHIQTHYLSETLLEGHFERRANSFDSRKYTIGS